MKLSKKEVINILNGEGIYANEISANMNKIVTGFYTRLNAVNTGREDFHQKIGVPATGVPAEELTQRDFQNAVSRLMYGNNVCLALSSFQGNILIATNKEDYSDDVLLPNLRSNYNGISRYIKLITTMTSQAHKPLWVDNKLVQYTGTTNYDSLAGNLASAIVVSKGIKKQAAVDLLTKLNSKVTATGGTVKCFMEILDTDIPFEEAWAQVVQIVSTECGPDSEEANSCRDFTTQYNLESRLQVYKEFAKMVLDDFFVYKSTHYAGDLVREWREGFKDKCSQEDRGIYEGCKSVIRDFLRDLVIVETFVSRHAADELIRTMISSDLIIVDDEGDPVSAKHCLFGKEGASSPHGLEIIGMGTSDVHAEMKILEYQLKHGGLTSYISISKLCCAFCHLTIDSIDHGSREHYPGYNGQGFTWKLSEWMKYDPAFLKAFLGDDIFSFYQAINSAVITLNNGSEVNAGELTLLLIEAVQKLPGFVTIPQGVPGASLASDNSFLINFGIEEGHIQPKYYSFRARDFVDKSDGAGLEVQLIGIADIHETGILN